MLLGLPSWPVLTRRDGDMPSWCVSREVIESTRPFSPRLFAAFAEVPRERYLGKGPWKISRASDPWTKNRNAR
jgi:hypothetical protein